MATTSHRAGSLKQQNKAHKHGKHKTKGQMDQMNRGKIGGVNGGHKRKVEDSRMSRKNKAKQIAQQKKEIAMLKKRGIGGDEGAPQIVGVISLCPDVDSRKIMGALASNFDDEFKSDSYDHVTGTVQRFKQRMTIVAAPRDVERVCDIAKLADVIVFGVSAIEEIDETGQLFMSLIRAQGVPSVAHVLCGLEKIGQKSRNDVKKYVLKKAQENFPLEEKIFPIMTSPADADNLVRHVVNIKRKPLNWREMHPYVMADKLDFEGDSEMGTLKVTGFLRGKPLSANGLVHVQGFGDFQIEKIVSVTDPCPLKSRRNDMDGDDEVLDVPDPVLQENLESEVTPDPMDAEQTWPTEEEMMEAEERQSQKKLVKKIPKGFSSYQAAWIVEEEVDDIPEAEGSNVAEDEMVTEDRMVAENESDEEGDIEDDDEFEYQVVSGDNNAAEQYDAEQDDEEEKEGLKDYLYKRTKDAEEDLLFPDEVDTPMDMAASVRFQKYRGMKSFKNTPWDPKENLPTDMARIFQFRNFDATKKRVLSQLDGVSAGTYCCIYIKNVPRAACEQHDKSAPFIVYGLLQYENKMTILNTVVKKSTFCDETIKSKEELVFFCGFRKFTVCPTFSQHTNASKHKYEKFLHNGQTVVATMFAPVTYAPSPVLVFKNNNAGDGLNFVGSGSVLNVNADRLNIKKIILSGHPFKINTRSAVIRYMFFRVSDIDWFKPVELWTKYGRRGHIKESLGTHGHMKCTFDGPLKNQDTICMSLYKRMFPKWSYKLYQPIQDGSNLRYVEEGMGGEIMEM
eukprot:Nk52_evm40s1129 gene=Nk52_evmTU40s1129